MSPRRAKAIRNQTGKNEDPGEALREHLVATAERLLEERQITEITTRDIAREAEVSDGVLYNYFASKNDLLVTALVRRFARDVQRFLDSLPEPGTATVAENLDVFARAMFDLNASALPIAAGLIADPPLLHKFLFEIHQPPLQAQLYRQHIVTYLAEEQRLGRISDVNVEAATTLLSGATAMLALAGLIQHRAPENDLEHLHDLVVTLIRGLHTSSSSD